MTMGEPKSELIAAKSKDLPEANNKYWEGRIPPPEYFRPADPYSLPNVPVVDHSALAAYAKQEGKAIAELNYDEVQQFIVKKPEGW